jgi:glycosyltransferase involved in cell wall biosynthesis
MSEEGPGLAATPEPTALFVGRGGIRKGLHLLLRAWARAGVRGRLAVVGTLDPELARLRSAELSRPDVEVVPFRDPVAPVYRSAQIFLFPTLEEGSPLVVYEAMSAGLACVLSPMGAGEVGRPGRDCLVVDPADEEGWVGAIRSVVGDAALRERLGREARERAREFTWDRVALRRRAQLEEARSAGRSAP